MPAPQHPRRDAPPRPKRRALRFVIGLLELLIAPLMLVLYCFSITLLR